MLELPEVLAYAKQLQTALQGKIIKKVYPPTNVHKLTWFNGDPKHYDAMLQGKAFTTARGFGIVLELEFTDTYIAVDDGIRPRYLQASEEVPAKYQLLLEFTDQSKLVFTVMMYGGILAHKGDCTNEYYQTSISKKSILAEDYTIDDYFAVVRQTSDKLSAKAFLATEQRFPGLGNGVLQDILFTAGINPKRKIATLTKEELILLFHSMKETLQMMCDLGGRDTEKDIFGHEGRYHTKLSSKTYKDGCSECGGVIIKEAYMGGSVYYYPTCQK